MLRVWVLLRSIKLRGSDERLLWGRLYMLEEQCNTWGGITSVAVYLPLIYFQASNAKKLQEAISHVEDFHEQIDRTHGAPQVLQHLIGCVMDSFFGTQCGVL